MMNNLQTVPGKIQPSHRQRKAALYVRQSTLHQLQEHQESTQRQYQLTNRLIQLGWAQEDIVVIDQDLGVSGSHSERRPGFARLLQMITRGEVGLVLGLEMSRLARNSKDWHDLFEVCAIFESLIADEDGVFNPNDPNDRLVLGLKGMISEMELHTMKVRLERGRLSKARRGELFLDCPVGFVKNEQGTLEKDPDRSAQAAIATFFQMHQTVGSANGLFHALAKQDIRMPFRKDMRGKHLKEIQWRIAQKSTVADMIRNPAYAGAYGYGRRKNYYAKKVVKRGSKHPPHDQWTVCIPDRFEGYITWQQYLDNQQRLRDNQSGAKGNGGAKSGRALLAGMIFCAKCGRRMSTMYGKKSTASYYCLRHASVANAEACGTTMAHQVADQVVAQRILQALEPSSLELQFRAVEDETLRRETIEVQHRHSLQRATYQVELARRRYESVDPDNRLVATTLEQDWESALNDQRQAQETLQESQVTTSAPLCSRQKQNIRATCQQVPVLWQQATNVEKKQLIRLMVKRVSVRVEDNTDVVTVSIVWAGEFESCHTARRPVHRYEQLDCYQELLSQALSLTLQGKRAPEVARLLTKAGFLTARNQKPLSYGMVLKLLEQDESAREQLNAPKLKPNQWHVDAIASEVGMPVKRFKDWVTKGWAHAVQRPFGRTWVIWADSEELSRLKQLQARQAGRTSGTPPEELTRSGFTDREKE